MSEMTRDPDDVAWDAVTPTLTIERVDGGPRLVIEEGDVVIYASLSGDSDAGAFDAWAMGSAHRRDLNRITEDDIVAINRFGVRSPRSAWASLVERGELPWLRALPDRSGLLAIDEEGWPEVRSLLADALDDAMGPWRNLATVTKMLHLKRPGLVPVLDRLVVEQIGGSSTAPLELIDHLRRVGRTNELPLVLIGANLEKVHLELTAVRILDAVL
jgi:hypothetical protein